ncbi:MAG: hypothetical protein ACO3VH_06650, partial [Ilumatobacteraceae bacterium]
MGSGALSAPVVRVLPDRSGPDKSFDYLWPHPIDDPAELIGARVRVDLHGRRVGGWVVETVGSDLPAIDSLKTVATMSGLGPTVDLIGLAGWAANRWAGRRSQFLSTASPPRAVRAVGAPRRTGSAPQPNSPAAARLLDAGGGVLRLPPGADQFPAIA